MALGLAPHRASQVAVPTNSRVVPPSKVKVLPLTPTTNKSVLPSAAKPVPLSVLIFCAVPPTWGDKLLVSRLCTVGTSELSRRTCRVSLMLGAGLPALSRTPTCSA